MTLAIVFPGQGSQSVGMMKGFADLPIVEQTFREASAIAGIDYWAMANEGPAELQNQTVNTQPLMLVAGVACWRAWRELGGPMPAYFARCGSKPSIGCTFARVWDTPPRSTPWCGLGASPCRERRRLRSSISRSISWRSAVAMWQSFPARCRAAESPSS